MCSTFRSITCCAHAGFTDVVGTFRGTSTSACVGWGLSIQTPFTLQVPHRFFDIALQLSQSIDKSGITPQNATCFAFCTSNFSSNHMTNEGNRLALPIYVQPRSLHLRWSHHDVSAFFKDSWILAIYKPFTNRHLSFVRRDLSHQVTVFLHALILEFVKFSLIWTVIGPIRHYAKTIAP